MPQDAAAWSPSTVTAMRRIPSRSTSAALRRLPDAETTAMAPNQSGKLSARPKVTSNTGCTVEIIENSIAKPSACAAIETTTVRWPNTSPAARRRLRGRSGRRASGGSVSGWRSVSQPTETVQKRANARKIERHPADSMMSDPRRGATAGTIMNTVITNDMILAIARPA